MGEGAAAFLGGWESFYVITGTAAAALTGLQFVVVTLGAQMHRGDTEANRAFGTPTIVHFCAVLFIAAVLSAPWPSLLGAALVLGLCGVGALLYAGVILRIVRRQTAYTPVMEDWIWHFTLPPSAYALLLVAAIILPGSPGLALFLIAGVVLLLLSIGIHNSWDSATFIALQLRPQGEKREDS